MSEEHDDRLQVEAAQRDPARFAELYEQNFYAVYAWVARRVGNRHEAEDLTADVFREALARRAIEAGATSLWPPTDQLYGDRTAGLLDPFGFQWMPASHARA